MKKLIISVMLVALCVFASACSTSKTPDKQTATTTSTTTAQTTALTTTTTTAKPTTTTTAKPTTTTTATTQTTTTKSYDKLTELKEINNYSTAKDYLTNASDKDRIRLIAKELEIENLKGVIKNFTPDAYDDGDDKTPQLDNEYGYYAKIQLSKVDYPSNINKQIIQESATWWDISKGDVKYYRNIPRGALTSSGAIILTVWSTGFLVDNNTEYYLYVKVHYSRVSDYYIRENKN